MSDRLNKLDTKAICVQPFHDSLLKEKGLSLDVLRLDLLHPIVSGNKYFKLRIYIEHALKKNCSSIATFGGYFSNHIVATAFTAQLSGLDSIGYIRGEQPSILSPSLTEAQAYGMQLIFLSRHEYDALKRSTYTLHNCYFIPEGGYGALGMKGASGISAFIPDGYSHVVVAVGTGTTLAGIIHSNLYSEIIGISALKNAFSLTNEIEELLGVKKDFEINHNYHFGGFAKHTPELLAFMQKTWQTNQLPTDIVYTSKTLYAILDLAGKGRFPHGSKILMIHSGGLQGNRSLPENSLPFL